MQIQPKKIIIPMLYYFALSASYVYWVSPHFQNAGFTVSFSLECSIVGFFVALIVSAVTSKLVERGKVSDIIVTFLIILYFYPQIVLFSFCFHDYVFFLYVNLYLSIVVIFNYFTLIKSRSIYIKERLSLFISVMVILSVFMIVISGAFTGFRISFNLDDYYEYRFAVRELSMPDFVKYLFNWAKTILPIGLVFAIINKKWWLVILTSVSEMLCFSFDGKKSSMFMFFLAFVIAFLYKKNHFKKIQLYMLFVNLFLFIEQFLRDGESFVGKNIIRRLMFIPAYLGWAFYDFFQKNELDYFRSSFLRRFGFVSPYSEGIPRIIGRIYNVTLSSIGAVNANTGLCGDAYSNLGWLGLLFFPFVIVIICKLFERYLVDLDPKLQIIISLTVAYAFLSGAFFTVLLTNGILVLMLLLIIIPRTSLDSIK